MLHLLVQLSKRAVRAVLTLTGRRRRRVEVRRLGLAEVRRRAASKVLCLRGLGLLRLGCHVLLLLLLLLLEVSTEAVLGVGVMRLCWRLLTLVAGERLLRDSLRLLGVWGDCRRRGRRREGGLGEGRGERGLLGEGSEVRRLSRLLKLLRLLLLLLGERILEQRARCKRRLSRGRGDWGSRLLRGRRGRGYVLRSGWRSRLLLNGCGFVATRM